ncbi:hypothetical protein [Streptomyces malaysiensis]|uniref:Uncharacterized protein n=1 Tax=Streptomyces malaysiensis subsp. samsunensis TaxID=459658 RepID=A0A9X2LXH6_STRMQ|nr:hypothetical protein [Streptomyces samsunensis]MCQ8831781.1 hypothetical protein [Streptomyces samsunensis]
MSTREQLLKTAADAMRRGLELNAQGADADHPDYAKVMPALHAAIAAGWTDTDVWQAAHAPQ